MNDTTHTAEEGAPHEHEHDVSCAFGNPTCPAFGEQEPERPSWWRRLRTRVTPPGEDRP